MPHPAAPILKHRRYGSPLDLVPAMERVRARSGKGAARQVAEILGALLGRRRMLPVDYYEYGLWRSELSAAEKAAFLSDSGSSALNMRLSAGAGLSALTRDKLNTGRMLRDAGLPAQKPNAVFGIDKPVPGADHLGSAAQIAAWLRQDGNLPIFGKPVHGTLCIGVASLLCLADQGKAICLGDGRTVNLDALAQEIATYFSSGYLFEPIIRQHPDVEAITGPAVGALRVVTLREPDGVRILYVAQRLPAVGAMNDGFQPKAPLTEALIDGATGRILRAQDVNQMQPDDLSASHVTGKPFAEVVLPYVKEAQDAACAAHHLLGDAALLGFDIALSQGGPVINEVNSNPFHSIYQRSADRGLMNPDFKPRLMAALALARRARR